jgi:hypothetical protein
MRSPRRALPHGITLLIGLVVGWSLASMQPAKVQADREDPGVEDQIAAGPVSIEHNPGLKIQVARDAIYYLDYKGGRLLAAIPSSMQSGRVAHMLDSFAERDLVADFKLVPGSASPHFLMTTGTMGALDGAWAPLFVFESTSKQVATYRVTPLMVGNVSKPRFDLIEIRPLPQPLVALQPGR